MIPDIETAVVVLQALIVPIILVLFYVDGLVIGKVTPPAAFYIGYVTLIGPETRVLAVVAVLSTLAATLGQYTLYRGFNEESPEFLGLRRKLPYVDRIPKFVRARIGKRRMRFVTRLFDRFGGVSLSVTNAVPGIRSLMSIPAGLSRYPASKFLVFSTVGNALYLLALTAVGWGLIDLAGLLP